MAKLYSTRIFVSLDGYHPANRAYVDLRPVDLLTLARIMVTTIGGTILLDEGQWNALAFPNKTHFTDVYAVKNGVVLEKLDIYRFRLKRKEQDYDF